MKYDGVNRNTPEGLCPFDSDEMFKLYKDYAKHEDGLLNFRMTWILVINSFLFASIGVATAAYKDIPRLDVAWLANPSLYFITILFASFCGCLLTLNAWFGVQAAAIALGELNASWIRLRSGLPGGEYLPDLLGGVRMEKSKTPGMQSAGAANGNYAPQIMLWILGGGWLVIATFSVLVISGIAPLAVGPNASPS